MLDSKFALDYDGCCRLLRPLIITAPGDEELAVRLGLAAMSWSEFLLKGLSDED